MKEITKTYDKRIRYVNNHVHKIRKEDIIMKINNVIQQKNEVKTKINSNINDNSPKFKSILNNMVKNEGVRENVEPVLSMKASFALRKIEDILKIRITKKNYDENGFLKINEILKENKDKIHREDLGKLKHNISILYNDGVITLSECKQALEYLSSNIFINNVKEECKKEAAELVDGKRMTNHIINNHSQY